MNDFKTLYLGKWHLTGCMLTDREGIKCQGSSDHIFDYKGNKVSLCKHCYESFIQGRFNRPKHYYEQFYIGRIKIS